MDQISEFTFFISLARNGSLSATARELNLTPSAVTKRLTNLENRLAVRLINRTTRRLSLTNEGELYLKYVKNIVNQINDMESVISGRRDSPQGLLRVNAPLGFGRNYIAPIISEFVRQYPDIEVQLMLSDRPIPLPDESVDICIRFGDIPDSRVIARRIAPNRRLLCASPRYFNRHPKPEKPTDLAGHNCIIIKQAQKVATAWKFSHRQTGEESVIKVKGNLVTNDGEIALRWAIDGHGIVMRAEWDMARHIREGRLMTVLDDYDTPNADIYAIYMERLNISAKVSCFLDYLQNSFLADNDQRSFW